ncbi:MAG: AarF/ABC1/UbiB kinase family protein [bacterium]
MFENGKRLRRSARVARTGARIYLGYKRTQRKVRKLDADAAAAEWEQRHEQSARRLYQLAVELKGLYIKTGQFVGTRTDIVPGPYSAWLSKLQDQVPPHPYATVERTIQAELGKPIAELFATFEQRALGSASLAQVHRATLLDGREVVAKVQYPEVAGLVKLDVRNMKMIVGLVARREPNFDYRAIVNEIASQVPLELDFVREAEMTRRIRHNLREIPNIVLPEVIEGYVSRRVLVTEFIPGVRLLDKEAREALHPDPALLAQTIANAYGHQIMVDGLFQADPHPGNILVLPDGKAALLDFGLTKDLPDAMRLGFARLVIATSTRDAKGIVAAFKELGVKTQSEEPEDVLPLMQLLFDPRPVERGGGRSGFGGRRAAVRANPVEAIPGDLVLLGRVIGLLRGVCASLGTPLSPMQMLKPYAERALAEG